MQKNTHIYALDGLRGIAVLMVMIFHFHWQPLSPFIQKIAIFGQTGVDLFFVLSGFLITRILLVTKHNKNYFNNFYCRRILRIFPLYYGFLILIYFVLPRFNIGNTPPFNHQLWYYLYLQNIPDTFIGIQNDNCGHFWSLAVEEHFYLFWPFLVYYLSPIRLMWASFGIIILSLIIRIILVNFHLEVFYFTPCRFDALAIGALLAYFEYKEKLLAYRKYLLNLGIFSFILLITTWLFTGAKHLYLLQVIKFPIVATFYFSIVGYASIQHPDHIISKILSSRLLLFTGKISYSLYVFHCLVYSLFENSNYFAFSFFLCFSLTYFIAYLSYEIYEKPFLNLKKYFEYT